MAFRSDVHPDHLTAEVRRRFNAEQTAEVFRILNGLSDFVSDPTWTKLAIVHLSEGHPHLLQQWVDIANRDSRDLLVALGRLPPLWDQRYTWPPPSRATPAGT